MRRLATALVCMCGFLCAEGVWAQAIDKGKIWDANRGAVVKIHAFGTGANNSPKSIDAGTGIFVSREGYILTALHVVGKDEDWSKVGPDQMPDRRVEVTLLNHAGSPHVISRNAYVKIIPGVDLALLRVDGYCFQYAKLAAQRPSGFPTLVAIVWGADTVPHPTSADLTETTDVSLSGDKLTLDRIAAPGGYSGSPLFNAAGEVVGVLDNRLGDFRALAIPSTEAITSVQAITSVPVTNTDPNPCGPVPPVPDSAGYQAVKPATPPPSPRVDLLQALLGWWRAPDNLWLQFEKANTDSGLRVREFSTSGGSVLYNHVDVTLEANEIGILIHYRAGFDPYQTARQARQQGREKTDPYYRLKFDGESLSGSLG
jgi:hypothetical protein